MKKLVSILLALALIFALSITAFADGETYTLTMNGIKGHTYKVFQIYTGDVDKVNDKLVLSNVKYGQNHFPVDGQEGDPVPHDELQNFLNSADHSNYFKSQITGEPIETVNTNGTLETADITVAGGYYLIVDVTNEATLPDGQTKSPVLLKVAENTTITSKHASISSEKKVDDKNDSTTDEDDKNWVNSADYDIGDAVPFKLSVTLPSTLNTYSEYELTFHDKQEAGFAAPTITAAYILKKDGTTKITIPEAQGGASGYTLTNSCTKSDTCEFGGCSFNVKVGDVKKLYGTNTFEEGDQIIIEYTSVLENDANIGRAGNENGMYVCHPDGHTPVDYVTVLTYELKVNKVDGDTKQALEGAGFTLYKWSAEKNDWVAVGEEITGVTNFTWTGIDGGKYKLVETTTPAGYNTIADIEFVVDSDHKLDWIKGGNAAFEDLIAKTPDGTKIVFADAAIVDGNSIEDGKLEGNVENYKGVVLPETGARGTFMLLSISTMVVLVAVVFMITRKKMSVYED